MTQREILHTACKGLGESIEASLDRRPLFELVALLFKECYASGKGVPWFAVNGRDGTPVGQHTLLPELGDYLPFLAMIGETDYVQGQRRIVEGMLLPAIEPLNPNAGSLRWLKRQNPFYFSDLILGLLDCHALGLGDQWLAMAEDQTNRVMETFWKGDGLCKERFLASGWRLPICESDSLVMAEIMLDLYQANGNQRYLQSAEAILSPWLELAADSGVVPQVRPLAWWPRWIPRFARRSQCCLLYKHNFFFLSALASLARVTQDPELEKRLITITFSALRHFQGEATVPYYRTIATKRGLIRDMPTLKCTLLADHCCDIGQEYRNGELLEIAMAMAEFWLDQRHPKTGLIAYQLNDMATNADAITDFAVTLIKLHAASGQQKWLTAALELLAGMLTYHLGPFGLYLSVDIRDGRVLEPTVETRYVSLFLKPWLLLDRPGSVYEQPLLLSLVKDR